MIKPHSQLWLKSTSINWSSSLTCFFLSPSFSELVSSSRSREFIWLIYERQEVSLEKQHFLILSGFFFPLMNHWIPRQLKSKNQEYLDKCFATRDVSQQMHRALAAPWDTDLWEAKSTKFRVEESYSLSLELLRDQNYCTDLCVCHPKLTFLFADDNSFWSCSHSLFKLSFSCSMALTIPDWLWCFWCFRERIVDSSCRIWGDQRWTNVEGCPT